MHGETDWRIDSCKRLKGVAFRRKAYHAPSAAWDHDRCAACFAKFADSEEPEILREGYATTEDYKMGADHDWVCPSCFSDLREAMEWTETR